MAVKVKKKEYEILEGEIINPDATPSWKQQRHSDYSPMRQVETKKEAALVLRTERDTEVSDIFTAGQAVDAIKKCKAAGIHPGVRVIRVNHIKLDNINNPCLIGRVSRFLMYIVRGQRHYYPLMVSFASKTAQWQMPMALEEIETYGRARLQLNLPEFPEKPLEFFDAEPVTATERIIQNFEERAGSELMTIGEEIKAQIEENRKAIQRGKETQEELDRLVGPLKSNIIHLPDHFTKATKNHLPGQWPADRIPTL